jgi:hypothetical protein
LKTDDTEGMKKNKVHWLSKGSTIFTTLFFVFCIAFIWETRSSMRISKHGLQSIAPGNLRSAPESFRLKLIVESPDFPAEEMAETEAWKGLQASVDAYADRLETTRDENRRRMMGTSILYLCSALGMAVFSVLIRKREKRELAET